MVNFSFLPKSIWFYYLVIPILTTLIIFVIWRLKGKKIMMKFKGYQKQSKVSRKRIVWTLLCVFILVTLGIFFLATSRGREILRFRGLPSDYVERSVRLNNYGNFSAPDPSQPTYNNELKNLYKYDRTVMTEEYSYTSQLTPEAIKAANPKAKVYRLYGLNVKSKWESDWGEGGSDKYWQTPISYADITTNDWWLRDGKGNIVEERGTAVAGKTFFLDVGKPGFKEKFLENALKRMEDKKGFDGIVLDYWWPQMMTRWLSCYDLPIPEQYKVPDSEPNKNKLWFDEAWKPFLDYVLSGVEDGRQVTIGLKEKYEIIGNNVGEYGTSDEDSQYQRSLVDGVVYEQWAVDWDGKWLNGGNIETRINAFQNDPLEVWTADFGIRNNPTPGFETTNYQAKADAGLAMYYLSLPLNNTLRDKRFYHHYKDSEVFWEPLWDFYIGTPAAEKIQVIQNNVKKYAWSRKYSEGLVLLNYGEKTDSAESLTFSLDKNYVDFQGKSYSGKVTLTPHTALILRVAREVRSAKSATPTSATLTSPAPTLAQEETTPSPFDETPFSVELARPDKSQPTATPEPVSGTPSAVFSPTPTATPTAIESLSMTTPTAENLAQEEEKLAAEKKSQEQKTSGNKTKVLIGSLIVLIVSILFYAYLWARDRRLI